jgi:hypothetical protein
MSRGKKQNEDGAQPEDPPETSSSGFVWVEPLLNKKKESVLVATDSAIADATARSSRSVRYLNTDGKSVMRSKEARALFRRKNIKHTMGAPYNSTEILLRKEQ